MAIPDVLEATGLSEKYEQGAKIQKDLLSRFKMYEAGYKTELKEMSDVNFENLMCFHAVQSLIVCNFSDESTAKQLPISIKRIGEKYAKLCERGDVRG